MVLLLFIFSIQSQATEMGAGLKYFHLDYAEQLEAPAKSTESGFIPMLSFFVTSPLPTSLGKESYFKFFIFCNFLEKVQK